MFRFFNTYTKNIGKIKLKIKEIPIIKKKKKKTMIHLIIGIFFAIIIGIFVYLVDPILILAEFLLKLKTFFPYSKEIRFYEGDSLDEFFGFFFYLLGDGKEINPFFLPFLFKSVFYHKFNFFYNIEGFIEAFQPRGFQTPESFNMELLIDTHNLVFTYCVFIFIFVSFFLFVTLFFYKSNSLISIKKGFFSKMDEWFYIYEKTMTRSDAEELYILEQYYYVTTSDGIFIESIPLKKTFKSFFYYNHFDVNIEKESKVEVMYNEIVESAHLLGLKKKSKTFNEKEIKKIISNSPRFPFKFDEIKNEWSNLKETVSNRSRKKVWDNLGVEIVWTLIPTLILIAIAVPSFTLLYALEPTLFYDNSTVFLKIIGHQWYWSYEFPEETFNLLNKKGNFPSDVEKSFSSYMLPTSELKSGMPRLLSVDNPLYLPINCNIIIRVTAEDVIHSWAIPSLGIKLDCIPGRINEFVFKIRTVGDLYGQCSELCGVNHGFMPIHIIAYEQ